MANKRRLVVEQYRIDRPGGTGRLYLLQPGQYLLLLQDAEPETMDEAQAIAWTASQILNDPNLVVAYAGSKRTVVRWMPPGTRYQRVIAAVEGACNYDPEQVSMIEIWEEVCDLLRAEGLPPIRLGD